MSHGKDTHGILSVTLSSPNSDVNTLILLLKGEVNNKSTSPLFTILHDLKHGTIKKICIKI